MITATCSAKPARVPSPAPRGNGFRFSAQQRGDFRWTQILVFTLHLHRNWGTTLEFRDSCRTPPGNAPENQHGSHDEQRPSGWFRNDGHGFGRGGRQIVLRVLLFCLQHHRAAEWRYQLMPGGEFRRIIEVPCGRKPRSLVFCPEPFDVTADLRAFAVELVTQSRMNSSG